MRFAGWSWMTVCGLLACGPGLPASDGTGAGPSSGEVAPTSGAAVTSTGGEASETSGSSGAASTGTETTASTGAADDGTFILPPDTLTDSCDPYLQNCPEGEKCTWYADDGGTSWNDTKCVPVVEDPAQMYEPCHAPEGGTAGIDDCDVGLMCWDVDDENVGACIGLCMAGIDDVVCEDPWAACAISSSGFGLCLHACDPILQDCDPNDVCVENQNGGGFLCTLDASGDEGQAHDPCEFLNACDPGLFCTEPTAAVECDQDAMGCCEPFCVLSDPACPGVGQVCQPYYQEGMAPPQYVDLGYCAVPM